MKSFLIIGSAIFMNTVRSTNVASTQAEPTQSDTQSVSTTQSVSAPVSTTTQSVSTTQSDTQSTTQSAALDTPIKPVRLTCRAGTKMTLAEWANPKTEEYDC